MARRQRVEPGARAKALSPEAWAQAEEYLRLNHGGCVEAAKELLPVLSRADFTDQQKILILADVMAEQAVTSQTADDGEACYYFRRIPV